MIKFNETLTTEGYFEINDIPHQKGQFDVAVMGSLVGVYRTGDKGGSRQTEDWLVSPTVYSSWTNSFDTPYPSIDLLLTDLRAGFFLLKGSGGGGSGQFLDKVTLDPQTVAGEVEFLQDITVPSGSVILGKNGAKLSSAGRSLQYKDARGLPTLFIEYNYDDAGSENPHYWSFGALQEEFPVAPDIDATILNSPIDLQFSGALGASMTTAIYLVPTTTGTLRLQIWEGTDDTGAVLLDQMFDVTVAGVTEKTKFELPVPIITDAGDLQFARFTGLNLHGALQTSGAFVGQVAPFMEFDVHLLEKKEILPVESIVQSVVAGENIDVDDTDPSNPIVNSTGVITDATLTGDGTAGDPLSAVIVGYVLATWGANLQTLGRHAAVNGLSNNAEIISLGIEASAPVPTAGIINAITYYNMTGDNTTEFQIIKNGVVMHTFTCIGPYGAETGINVPTGFVGSAPDNIAIRYSGGTAPSSGFYSMYIM